VPGAIDGEDALIYFRSLADHAGQP
jgi:hypothetical protein